VRELYISFEPKWAPNKWFGTLFMKSEVWERWISITGGAGTAFPCVQWHFNHCWNWSCTESVLMYRNGPLSKNYVPKWYVPKVSCTDMDLPLCSNAAAACIAACSSCMQQGVKLDLLHSLQWIADYLNATRVSYHGAILHEEDCQLFVSHCTCKYACLHAMSAGVPVLNCVQACLHAATSLIVTMFTAEFGDLC